MENPNTAKAKELFLRALGEASMCWSPKPGQVYGAGVADQVFDTGAASGIADREFPKVQQLIESGFAVKVSAMFRSAAEELDGLAVELRKRDS